MAELILTFKGGEVYRDEKGNLLMEDPHKPNLYLYVDVFYLDVIPLPESRIRSSKAKWTLLNPKPAPKKPRGRRPKVKKE